MRKRKKRPIGRSERPLRDSSLFVIATEDRYAPEQYFHALPISKPSRVKIEVLSTEDNNSSPSAVCERLKRSKEKYDIGDNDELWLVIDVDHHFSGTHNRGTSQALKEAREFGACVAVSNPCFEVWLLLHLVELADTDKFSNADAVLSRLRKEVGDFNKKNIRPMRFVKNVVLASERAQAIDDGKDLYLPGNPGTRVYQIIKSLRPYLDEVSLESMNTAKTI